jgi:hypothetical protein
MSYKDSPYFHIGRASELVGRDRFIYRILEILPGLLSVGTLAGIVIISAFLPVYAALFIIAFDLYWLLKTIYLSSHLRQNWKRMKHNTALDWSERLSNLKYDNILHLVILPFYDESEDTIESSLKSLIDTKWDKNKMAVVLASEERAGKNAGDIASRLKEKYKDKFGYFTITVHPKDVPGEMAGKGSNIAYSAEKVRIEILDKNNINYDDVIVSAFDIDTVVYPQYFLCLTWNFLTAENPYRTSFQPVPLYNNNIWESPALSRVVATSGTFWQMIQQERPERLATFSSHSLSFRALYEIGYWQKNMVSEDSRIFWNAYVAYDGDYTVVPLSYPISLDANLAETFFQTMKNIYKQQRRWTWGVENVPYILFSFLKNSAIPRSKKIKMSFMQIEGFWSLATNPLMIFLLGWLPIILGGKQFNETILAYNLPIITRDLMFLAMSGLILSAIMSMSFLPKIPEGKNNKHKAFMLLQWVLVPITMVFFGSIPGLDAQIRLMLGKYMGFWVTPKFKFRSNPKSGGGLG